MITQSTYFVYILIALQLLDAITTFIGLHSPGAYEENSFLNYFFKIFGVPTTLAIFKGAAIWYIWSVRSDIGLIGFLFVGVLYVDVIYKNYLVIKNNQAPAQ